MTHYTVTVKLSEKRLHNHGGDVGAALAEILAPYEESTDDERYSQFEDVTDEYRKKYDTELIELYRVDDELLKFSNEKFRVRGLGVGSGTHKPPEDKLVKCKPETIYGSFENYMEEYCGYDKNEDGRYGSRSNPNAKWDWYTVGGRWSGFYPLKPSAQRRLGERGAFGNEPDSGGDIVGLADLDFDAIATQTRERAAKFFDEYQRMISGEKIRSFDGPRDTAMKLGLVRVEQKTVTAGAGEVVLSWSEYVNPNDERRVWTDVCTVMSKEEFLKQYTECFNPISTYAFLDDSGWSSPGKMGWFGMSSDEAPDVLAYHKTFLERIKSTGPNDLLVCVDCHI